MVDIWFIIMIPIIISWYSAIMRYAYRHDMYAKMAEVKTYSLGMFRFFFIRNRRKGKFVEIDLTCVKETDKPEVVNTKEKCDVNSRAISRMSFWVQIFGTISLISTIILMLLFDFGVIPSDNFRFSFVGPSLILGLIYGFAILIPISSILVVSKHDLVEKIKAQHMPISKPKATTRPIFEASQDLNPNFPKLVGRGDNTHVQFEASEDNDLSELVPKQPKTRKTKNIEPIFKDETEKKNPWDKYK